MILKFKIGDKVKFKGGVAQYNFSGIFNVSAKKGDIFTISAVGKENDGAYALYSVEGSYMEEEPNWSSMEENFELVNSTLKDLIEK